MVAKRKRLGLALAGGMARGLAHVGVIQALEEAGFEADVVSGVSAGAIVGACYAAGMKAAELAEVAHTIRWSRLGRPSFLNPLRRGLDRLGLIDFTNLELMLIELLGDRTFDELSRPFVVGVTDMLTGEALTIGSGRVALAVRASSSVPGVVVPVRWRDRLLCDGFASNNVPIEPLRALDADVVVAVDIMPIHRQLPSSFFWAGSHAVCNLVRRSGSPLTTADLVITPDVAESSYLSLNAVELIRRGRAATEPLIPQLAALLTKRLSLRSS